MAQATSLGCHSIAFPLIGAGSGGGRPEQVFAWMSEELDAIPFDGEVRIVRFAQA